MTGVRFDVCCFFKVAIWLEFEFGICRIVCLPFAFYLPAICREQLLRTLKEEAFRGAN